MRTMSAVKGVSLLLLALFASVSPVLNAQTLQPPPEAVIDIRPVPPNPMPAPVPSLPAPMSIPMPTTPSATPGMTTRGLASAAVITPTAVGRTKGSYSFSPTGAATYQIPIWNPPGARGIQPNLSLVYNSQTGNGLLGPGWTVAGLSVIARCRGTWAQDSNPSSITLTSSDKLCIDGNRMRTVTGPRPWCTGGTMYETEVADFSLITACGSAGNGPAYFVVKRKDGLFYEYGNTTDSRVMPCSTCTTPYLWALDNIADRQGNNLVVSYQQAGGGYVPVQIKYTQTPASGATAYPNTIAFTYTNRDSTDEIYKYLSGQKIQQTSHLTTILVSANTKSVREYDLTYTPSPITLRGVLTSVQECGFTATGAKDCLNPTYITPQNPSAVGISAPSTSAGTTGTVGKLLTADIDGDGHDDLLYSIVSGTSATWYVKFGTASGFGAANSLPLTGLTTSDIVLLDDFYGEGQASILAPQGGVWASVRWNHTSNTFVQTSLTGVSAPSGSVNSNGNQCASADVTGDGKPDLICLHSDLQPYVRINQTGSSPAFSAETVVPTLPTQVFSLVGNNQVTNSTVRHMDFNGDGHQDLIGTVSTGNLIFPRGTGIFLSTGTNTAPGIAYTSSFIASGVLPVNFNNDACTDLAIGAAMYIWGCNGTSAQTITLPGAPGFSADWDGDGRTDLFIPSGTAMQVYRSQGDVLGGAETTGITAASGTYAVLDLDGDGLDDLVLLSSGTVTYGEHHAVGTPPDLVTNITDGYANSFSPTYVSIARSNYTNKHDGGYPDVDYSGPLYVMSQFVASAGNGQTYTKSVNYYGAHTNLQGRGFDSFYAYTSYDNRNQLYSTSYFERSFPFTGMSDRDETDTLSLTLLNHRVDTVAATVLDATVNNQRYFPYVGTRMEYANELNGSASTQVQTVFGYDSYGNATTITQTTTDEDTASPWNLQTWTRKTVHNITNDTTYWCLGHPSQTTVEHITPDGDVTQTTNIQVDYASCHEVAFVDEPTSNLQVTTSYTFAPTACGNITQIDVVGTNPDGTAMPTRTTKATYGTLCELPESVWNPQNELTTLTYNYTYGLPASRKDPNTLETDWTYDDFGRMVKETRPDSTYTTFTIGACNAGNSYCGVNLFRWGITQQDYSSTGTALHSAIDYYDALDRELYDLEQNVAGNYVYSGIHLFDSLGNLQYGYLPYPSSGPQVYHQYARDSLNRVLSDKMYRSDTGLNRETDYTYSGRLVSVKDPNLNVSKKYSNVWGQVGEVVDPSPGGTFSYAYDPFGKLKSMHDSAGNTSTWTFDRRGNLIATADPDRGDWTYEYDSLGELVHLRDAKTSSPAWTQVVAYDVLGRVTSRTEAEGISTWIWGTSATSRNIDQLACVNAFNASNCTSSPSGYREVYTYDSYGRPAATAYNADVAYQISYAYDATTGLLDNVTYPASTGSSAVRVKYGYAHGILNSLSDFNVPATVYWQLIAQDARGQAVDELLGNGVRIQSTTDPLTGLLTARASGTNASVYNNRQNLTYAWDLNQNLKDRIDNNQSGLDEHFEYDALNRVSYSTLTGHSGHTLDVAYDAIGNITSMTGVGSYDYVTSQAGCTYTGLTPQPHAVRKVGSSSYCYDANGNMTNRAGTTSLTYTSYNLPSAMTSGSLVSNFSYTPDRRYWKQSAQYTGGPETTIYIGGMFEKVSGATTTDYVHLIRGGSALITLIRSTGTNNETYYVTQDHLGSSSVVSDHTGALVVNESYSAFGSRRGSNWTGTPSATDWTNIAKTTRHGFTGQTMLDNLNLVHMNGRVYDNVIGRFVSADPMDGAEGDSQSYNRYAYVNNRPLLMTDPTGLDACFPDIGHIEYSGTDPDGTPFIGGFTDSGPNICLPDFPIVNPPGVSPVGSPTHFSVDDATVAAIDEARLNPQGNANTVRDFLCHESTEGGGKEAVDEAANAGSAADLTKAAVALGASAAGASKALSFAQASAYLGFQAASGLARLGRAGGLAAQLGIAYDLVTGDYTSAAYDTADFFAYSAIADFGAIGAVETAGGSVVVAGALAGSYYNAGGAKGIVQSAVCPP